MQKNFYLVVNRKHRYCYWLLIQAFFRATCTFQPSPRGQCRTDRWKEHLWKLKGQLDLNDFVWLQEQWPLLTHLWTMEEMSDRSLKETFMNVGRSYQMISKYVWLQDEWSKEKTIPSCIRLQNKWFKNIGRYNICKIAKMVFNVTSSIPLVPPQRVLPTKWAKSCYRLTA